MGREPKVIDAVVTWVDGSDPAHCARRLEAERQLRFNINAIPGGKSLTRFADSGELKICLRSIRRFCPWIRWIHLVTDQQRPAFLDDELMKEFGVRLVDHSEIFRGYEWALPTFNSQSIECMLHRIEGLSEHFVYFNDDVLVLGPTEPKEFFRGGKVILRGSWEAMPRFGRVRTLLSSSFNYFYDKVLRKVRSMAMLAQFRGARLAGMTGRLLVAPHVPHPLRRSTFRHYFDANPDVLADNIRFKFRDMRQFAPVPLANHLEIQRGSALIESIDDHVTICFNRDSGEVVSSGIQRITQGGARFACVQGLEVAPSESKKLLVHAFGKVGLLGTLM